MEDMLEISLTEDEDDNDASFLIAEVEEEDSIYVTPSSSKNPKLSVYQQGGRWV